MIEISPNTCEERTKIFYCEPGRLDQRGSCEVNHEFIRRVLPQGAYFDSFNQEDINLLIHRLTPIKKLNDCSSLQMFSLMYDQ